MKKHYTAPFMRIILMFAVLFSAQAAFGQILWDGGGDGTSWNDAANWAGDVVPPADSLVAFEMDAVVTGTVSAAHARINVRNRAVVTFNLNITIGNGVTSEHSLVVGTGSTLNIAAGRTVTLQPSTDKQALPIFATADTAVIHIAAGATLRILQGNNGINIVNVNSTLVNDGVILMSSAVKNGIKSAGTFINNGIVSLDHLSTDGIIVDGGVFENHGTITVSKPMDDCIEILGNALMRNFGTLELVAQDSAGTGNNSIAVGTDVIAGNFVNEASGIITASGGAKEAGRAISVNALGVFTNRGNVTLSGFPGAGARLYNRGQSLNDLGGVLNLGDGRANLNTGSLTNSGLIKSVREGSGIFTATGSQAINNGFFNYNMSGQFAAGMGTTTNNGIDLNNAAQTTINAGGACSVDIAQAPYAWFQGATQVATANDEGLLTFPAMSLTADPVQLSNGIPGVVITVQNVCPAALMTSSVFSPVTATALRLYPSLLRGESELTVEMPESVQHQSITFEVAGMDGRVLRRETTAPGRLRSLRTGGLQAGLYFVRAQSDHLYFLGKFVLID